jgi:hypothetical protein
MNFASVVVRLKAEPLSFLDKFCPESLRPFLAGYNDVDSSAYDVIKALLDVFPGAEQADACSRVYLTYPDSADGASAILNALEKILVNGELKPEEHRGNELTFVDALRGPIVRGRAAMILGEPTVVALYNYVRGFLSGLEVISPVEALTQARDLSEFECWLQKKYQVPGAAWYKLIRIHEGACERGLTRFIVFWDEFMKSRSFH